MAYRKPERFFEDSGTVDPEASYYVRLDNVTNTKGQDIKTMVDRGAAVAGQPAGNHPDGKC